MLSAGGAGGTLRLALLGAVLCIALVTGARAQPPRVEVRTSDVALFYRVYDATGGAPSAAALQEGYLDAGSDGVRQFIPDRIRSAEALEVACRSRWLQRDLTDRLVHLIAHEYGHVQQFPQGGQAALPNTVLNQSLVEGVAELIAELTSGEASESYLNQWAQGRARQIDEAFLADLDSTDLKPWLYNGVGSEEKPGDLGYWVGYRIARAYYRRASDKHAAMETLLQLQDPKKILADSGWKPGDLE